MIGGYIGKAIGEKMVFVSVSTLVPVDAPTDATLVKVVPS